MQFTCNDAVQRNAAPREKQDGCTFMQQTTPPRYEAASAQRREHLIGSDPVHLNRAGTRLSTGCGFTLGTVLRARLLAIAHSSGIQGPTNNVIPHAGEIFDAPSAY